MKCTALNEREHLAVSIHLSGDAMTQIHTVRTSMTKIKHAREKLDENICVKCTCGHLFHHSVSSNRRRREKNKRNLYSLCRLQLSD